MNQFNKVVLTATVFFIYACGANKESSPLRVEETMQVIEQYLLGD